MDDFTAFLADITPDERRIIAGLRDGTLVAVPHDEIAVQEALRESAYQAGVTAGWNLGIVEDTNGLAVAKKYRGHLKPISDRRKAKLAAASVPGQPT